MPVPLSSGRAGLWYLEAAGTLAGTPAFNLMDMSKRKEPSFFSGSVLHPSVQACGYGQSQALRLPFQLKAALQGWMQGIWVAQSAVGETARRSGETWAPAPARSRAAV